MSIDTATNTGLPACPYPGLRPFGREEAVVFFGRDEHVDQLLTRLENHRFLAVTGVSGCGKSSLVRAGLIPALEAGYMSKAGFRWHVAVMRPSHHPMRNLCQAVLDSSLFDEETSHSATKRAFLQATLRSGRFGLVDALRNTPAARGQNLLLVVDQFEEIFRSSTKRDSGERHAFVDLLLGVAESRDVGVYVVITVRSESLGHVTIVPNLPEAINDSQFLTPRLTRAQIRTAIEAPASVYDGEIVAEVVSRILNEIATESDQLPLMQHLLMRMWRCSRNGGGQNQPGAFESGQNGRTLTLDDYRRVGGVANALSDHVERVYGDLDTDPQRDIAQVLFRRLTEIGSNGQATRRSATASEVAAVANAPVSDVVAVANVFRAEGCSFLMSSDPGPLKAESSIDISHESLIRQWSRLKDWAEKEAESAREYSALSRDARFRYGRRGGDLWTGSTLQRAREWWQKQSPNEAWADRYDGDYEASMRFLDESVARAQQVQQEQEARQLARRRRRRLVLAFLLVLITIAPIAGLMYTQHVRATVELRAAFDLLSDLSPTLENPEHMIFSESGYSYRKAYDVTRQAVDNSNEVDDGTLRLLSDAAASLGNVLKANAEQAYVYAGPEKGPKEAARKLVSALNYWGEAAIAIDRMEDSEYKRKQLPSIKRAVDEAMAGVRKMGGFRAVFDPVLEADRREGIEALRSNDWL
jgi:energy-coupling factor transporter ATP-binding protein EcfA2